MTDQTATITEVRDANGNVATIAYWGSEKEARASLATLKNCKDCRDCSGCSGCSGCSRCSDCSRCWDCSDCSRCWDCSGVYLVKDKKADTGSHLQPVIPTIQNIHQAVYSAASAPNALNMGDWHTCDTTHCRAGWVVTLAGEEGKKLEEYWTTSHAAWLIYKASDPGIKYRPDFFCTNDRALEDMKRLADEEAART